MRYKVTFRKRFNEQGQPWDEPTALVSTPDGVIQDSEFVEILEPPSLHVTEDLISPTSQNSEDDGFLAFGTETWVYDIVPGREQEFLDAVRNSEVALAIEEVPDESLTT
jgi:hypothetical protein